QPACCSMIDGRVLQRRGGGRVDAALDVEPPLHPQRCGPCPDCREFLAEENARRRGKPRDRALSYGIPPQLSPGFQQTRTGPLFLPASCYTRSRDCIRSAPIRYTADGASQWEIWPELTLAMLRHHEQRFMPKSREARKAHHEAVSETVQQLGLLPE